MNNIISFIIVLGVLIFVHELGHFLFAKLFKVRVLVFSLGFGPKICSRKVGDTEYRLSAFPLGGYVKMFGEDPREYLPERKDKSGSFALKSVWQRFLIIFAGPFFNLVFASIIFTLIFIVAGVPKPIESTIIGKVVENSAASEAGLLAGDQIIKINDKEIIDWKDIVDSIKSSDGREIDFIISRNGERIYRKITPTHQDVTNAFGEVDSKRYMIGISREAKVRYDKVSLLKAASLSVSQTATFVQLTVAGFVKIVQRTVPASDLGGPILIAQMAGQQLKAGWLNLVFFMGLLSVNLAVLNLLPVPVLDGGHLVFLTVEAIRSKPLTIRSQMIAQQIGMALLGSLMLFVFYNDLVRILRF